MSLLELLQNGDVDSFNAARGRHAAPDLFAADLSGLDLTGVDLSGADLEKADLSGTNLSRAILVQTNLSGADLTAARMDGAIALKSRWKDAFLGEVSMDGADLGRADLAGADLTGARGEGVQLNHARMKEAVLVDVVFPGAGLEQAALARADLTRARLPGASMSGAALAKAVLRGADLSGADLTGARLSGADASGARLNGAVLREADLVGAVLDGADLGDADLTRADLGQASVAEAVFTGACLDEARMDDVDFSKAVGMAAPVQQGVAGEQVDEKPAALIFDDIRAAASGQGVGILWENPEGATAGRIRVAVMTEGAPWSGLSPALPDPADLVVAKGIMPLPDGFLAMLFVDRPGGLVCRVTEVSEAGELGATRTVPFDYVPAVRPVFMPEPEGFLVMGLSRRGPVLHVHRYNGTSFEPVVRERQPTARGFVGGGQPVVVCKGGVVFPLGPVGTGSPITAPAGFPGRGAVAATLDGGLLLAWIPPEGKGLRHCLISSGEQPETGILLGDRLVTSLDGMEEGGQVILAATAEVPGGGSCRLHGAWLPGGQVVELAPEVEGDLEQVSFVAGASAPLLAVLVGGARVCLVEPRPEGGHVRGILGSS